MRLVLFVGVCSGFWSAPEEVVEKTSLAVHMMEDGVERAVTWTKEHQRLVKLLVSWTVLFHGGRYSHTMLLVHTLKVTAGPLLKEALDEAAREYKAMRKEAEKQAPNFEEARKQLKENKKEIAKLHSSVMTARREMPKAEFQKFEKEQRGKVVELVAKSEGLRTAVSSLHAVVNAIDGNKVKKIGTAVYAAVTSAVASATSQTAAVVAVGLNIARQAATTLRGVILPLASRAKGMIQLNPTTAKWIKTAVTTVGTVVGVYVAYSIQHTALVIATCYFASGAFLTTASTMIDGILDVDTPLFSALHVALATLGFVAQLKRPDPPLSILRFLLKPLDLLEAYLRGLTLAHIRSAPPSFLV